jgi:hypothetical protein
MRNLKGAFDGWVVDESLGEIWGDAGNVYEIGEIRALFYFRQWQNDNDFEGANGRIRSLKEHLEKKIEKVKLPTVTVDWGDIQERYVHPHYRK